MTAIEVLRGSGVGYWIWCCGNFAAGVGDHAGFRYMVANVRP